MKRLLLLFATVATIQPIYAGAYYEAPRKFVLERILIDTVLVCDTVYVKRITDKNVTDYAVEYVMECHVKCTSEVRTLVLWSADIPEKIDVSSIAGFRVREREYSEFWDIVPCGSVNDTLYGVGHARRVK